MRCCWSIGNGGASRAAGEVELGEWSTVCRGDLRRDTPAAWQHKTEPPDTADARSLHLPRTNPRPTHPSLQQALPLLAPRPTTVGTPILLTMAPAASAKHFAARHPRYTTLLAAILVGLLLVNWSRVESHVAYFIPTAVRLDIEL